MMLSVLQKSLQDLCHDLRFCRIFENLNDEFGSQDLHENLQRFSLIFKYLWKEDCTGQLVVRYINYLNYLSKDNGQILES